MVLLILFILLIKQGGGLGLSPPPVVFRIGESGLPVERQNACFVPFQESLDRLPNLDARAYRAQVILAVGQQIIGVAVPVRVAEQ